MKAISVILTVLLLWNFSFSQTFSYSSSKNFGTSGNDIFGNACRLPNGETIMCGIISTASDDHTGALYGNQDYWVIKTDANDNIVWEKVFGGSGNDSPFNIEINSAGEIFIIGTSDSPNDGNKTTAVFGYDDIWVVKLDTDGTLLDQFSYGTTLGDELFCGATALDANENIIICARVSAGVSGNKTSPAYGMSDVWLFRIDSQGNKLDDTCLGGTAAEAGGDVTVDANNQIYVSIQSESGISGNKTTETYGSADVWIVKLNPNFDIIAQNSFGGTNLEVIGGILVSDENLFISLSSNSAPSGNKTCEQFGSYDGVIIRCDTLDLLITGQKSYGGGSTTAFFYGMERTNAGLLISGFSNGASNPFKDQNSFGSFDIWLLGVDTDLQPMWNQTIGGNSGDGTGNVRVIQTIPGKLEVYSDFSSNSMTGNLGCSNYGSTDFLHYVFDTDLGLAEENYLTSFNCYPNPANESIIIESNSQTLQEVILLSSDGKQLDNLTIYPGVNSVDLSTMSKGTYLLRTENSIIRFVKL